MKTYAIVPFISGKTLPDSPEHRLAKAVWKGRGVAPRPSMCASVPRMTDLDAKDFDVVRPYVLAMLESVQNRLVRDASESGKEEVSEDDISLAAIAAHLEQEQGGGRLSKEDVQQWFDASLAEILQGAVQKKVCGNKKPVPTQITQIRDILSEFRDKFSALAGGRTDYNVETAEMLLKAAELLEREEDAIADKMCRRLESMIERANKPSKLLSI